MSTLKRKINFPTDMSVFERYQKIMRIPKTFGGHLELVAASRKYETQIILIDSNQKIISKFNEKSQSIIYLSLK